MNPLRFEPLFRRYIWGGHRLSTVLGKPIGTESCAESWEIVDHNQDQSVVKYGDHAGKTISDLIREFGRELLGDNVVQTISSPNIPGNLRGRFPLLLKFLDANRNLSVQVHPDDVMAARMDPPDLGKTEAWYVMHADPGAKIFAGLKQDVTRQDFENAIQSGTTESCLHSFEPRIGDCVFIPAGTLHAIGSGLLIAEIQQASNTTYRVFDWNRVDKNGQPRELHIAESLEATNFQCGPIHSVQPQPTEFENAETIISCDKFVMRRWMINETVQFDDNRMHVLAVVKGKVRIEDDPSGEDLLLGNTVLIPASVSTFITPVEQAEILDIYLPY